MINGKYHFEDTKVIIDIADIGGKYETMKLRKRDGEEIESYTTYDFDVAENVFNKMVKEHTETVKPLTGKYAKLRDDLKAALAAAKEAADSVDDGGTCNLDAASLLLPQWNERLVEQAAKEAGTSAFSWRIFGGKRYVFLPHVSGQARKRERAAEAMTASLAAAGYNAFCYQQAD